MNDIYTLINENKDFAIKILNKVKRKISFQQKPYVLLYDKSLDNIRDLSVSQARLNSNGDIEIYIDFFEEWIAISDCISCSENNVYEAIVEEEKLTSEIINIDDEITILRGKIDILNSKRNDTLAKLFYQKKGLQFKQPFMFKGKKIVKIFGKDNFSVIGVYLTKQGEISSKTVYIYTSDEIQPLPFDDENK